MSLVATCPVFHSVPLSLPQFGCVLGWFRWLVELRICGGATYLSSSKNRCITSSANFFSARVQGSPGIFCRSNSSTRFSAVRRKIDGGKIDGFDARVRIEATRGLVIFAKTSLMDLVIFAMLPLYADYIHILGRAEQPGLSHKRFEC